MGLSLGHIILTLLVVFVLFGAGKIPRMMSDIGKGIRNLKEGLHGDEAAGSKKELTVSKPEDDTVRS